MMRMTHVVTGELTKQRATEDKSDMILVLNNLARYCVNGHFLYSQAAWKTKSEDLFALFDRYSSERNSFINELQALIDEMDGQIYLKINPQIFQNDFASLTEPSDEDVLIPSVKTADNNEVIWLARCINHDWDTLDAYDEVMRAHLPIHIHAKITEHYVKIARDIDTLELLYKTHRYWSERA